jgi:hypothetical protein
VNIVCRGAALLSNLVGLPTCPGLYDRFLIAVGLVMNVATLWIAWRWE